MVSGKDIKFIALDLDETALGSDGDFSIRLKDLFLRCRAAHIILAVATGRPGSALPETVRTTQGIRYIIHQNGSRILDLRGEEVIYSKRLDKDAVLAICDIVESRGVNIDVVADGRAFISRHEYQEIQKGRIPGRHASYVCQTRQPVADIYEFLRKNRESIEDIIPNYLSLEQKKETDRLLQQVKGITLTQSFLLNSEISAEATSKGHALAFLLALHGLAPGQLMALGDSHNDLSMIQFAGIGVAMGNAHQDIKGQADFITLSSTDDGAAHAIETIVFGGFEPRWPPPPFGDKGRET